MNKHGRIAGHFVIKYSEALQSRQVGLEVDSCDYPSEWSESRFIGVSPGLIEVTDEGLGHRSRF